MSWFFEVRERTSEKNGLIVATRRFGSWRVTVDGCEQTGKVVHSIWRAALDLCKDYIGIQKIKRILLLGLGAGGELSEYYRRFPEAAITVVEYDPQMIALAKELKLHRPYPFPTTICKDARDAVPALPGVFDLIVVDLFHGAEPSPLSTDQGFLEALDAKLAEDGYALANVYQKGEFVSTLGAHFGLVRRWLFGWNHVALYQKKTIPDSLSRGYLPVREWPDFDGVASIPPFFRPAKVGEKQEADYWWFWPFSFERYRGDEDPKVVPLPKEMRAPIRALMWQRRTRHDVPTPWTAFSTRPLYKIGFTELDSEYAKRWSENARRARREWHADFLESRYRLDTASLDEFSKALGKSTLPKTMHGMSMWEIRFRSKNPKTPVELVVVRRVTDGRIVAGMARMYSASLPVSYYIAGFFLKEARRHPVMTGLFDDWFQDSLARGVRYVDFGTFWKPGDFSSWKGFSSFKAKFNPRFFFFPPLLYQFRFFEK